jgi:hypothetical protein
MAATFAGLGFGNAGVHIPHANGYPIAGRVKDFHPEDYPSDEPLVPHGMSVALTASEACGRGSRLVALTSLSTNSLLNLATSAQPRTSLAVQP